VIQSLIDSARPSILVVTSLCSFLILRYSLTQVAYPIAIPIAIASAAYKRLLAPSLSATQRLQCSRAVYGMVDEGELVKTSKLLWSPSNIIIETDTKPEDLVLHTLMYQTPR